MAENRVKPLNTYNGRRDGTIGTYVSRPENSCLERAIGSRFWGCLRQTSSINIYKTLQQRSVSDVCNRLTLNNNLSSYVITQEIVYFRTITLVHQYVCQCRLGIF